MAVISKGWSSASKYTYTILDGATELETSARFNDKVEHTEEYCLTETTNSQYTLRISGSTVLWSCESRVSVAGVYGNSVLKTTLASALDEVDYVFSMYYPVLKNAEWKMLSATTDIASDWYAVAFDDSAWNAATLGSVTTAATGSQYFRKSFTSISGMAAYEVELNYRYGIVVYVNGAEVFRDHMAEGAVTPATASTDAYEAYEYHGVIRPAGEIEGSSNVLAVELHFPADTTENAVDFDAYVALIASSLPATEDTKCAVYPYTASFSASEGTVSDGIFDWNTWINHGPSASELPVTVTYDLTGPRAHVNALRVWGDSWLDYNPASFSLSGAMSALGTYTTVLSVSGATYEANAFKTFYGYFNAKPFQSYQVVLSATAGASYLVADEMQPMTCHDLLPASVVFLPSALQVYATYDSVTFRPLIPDFSSCTVEPALPEGVTLDATTCTVSGTPRVGLAQTTFTVTSVMNGENYQGTFTLEVLTCSATLAKVVRVYKSYAITEWFTITDVETQEVVLNVAANSTQVDNTEWSSVLCLSKSKYRIDVGCTKYSYWSADSFLYIRGSLFSDEYETITRVRYNALMGIPESYVFNAQWAVAPQSQWFYKMSDVPVNWYSSDTTGWGTASMGSFPTATNQIQMYKKTFTIADLSGVGGFVVSLRYLYGCVIYLNGVEVFRNGVVGTLTTSNMGTNAYEDLMYRKVSLPARTVGTDEAPSVNYLVEGANTIAIALLARTAAQTTSVFDCAVRLMTPDSRVSEYTPSHYGAGSSYSLKVADQYQVYYMFSDSCSANYWALTFNNDRREWLSAMTMRLRPTQSNKHPGGFTVRARNTNVEEWTTLKVVTGLIWTRVGEEKKFWLESNTPYNQYRVENITASDASSCSWEVGGLGFVVDSLDAIPELSYPTPLTLYRGAEMEEAYPTSEYYYDFSVSPALPEGLSIDPYSGRIAGVVNTFMDATTYTITAKKAGGGTSSTSLTLSVVACFGDKHLVSLVAYLYNDPGSRWYTLYAGKGTDGDVVASISAFSVGNGLNYADWCLPHGIYTVALYGPSSGWDSREGWYLTVDEGEMIFEMGQVGSVLKAPSITTTSFSSLLPFQAEYDSWKVFNSAEVVAEDWKSVSFDDSAWETKKAAELGNHASTTACIRHEVTVPSLDDYHVLNVRVKYAGGVVAYFNGVKVARFNLAEDFDATTEAMAAHNATTFSKFHVILFADNAVEGTNMIAFEIHRAPEQSELVFDATGVFGVNDCSIVLDSFSEIESSELTTGTKEDFFNMISWTSVTIPPVVGWFLSWSVENLEGSRFNNLGVQSLWRSNYNHFVLSGRWNSNQEYLTVVSRYGYLYNTKRESWSMPVLHASFNEFKFLLDAPYQDIKVAGFHQQYCLTSGKRACAADGEYPAVNDNEQSVVKGGCPEGMYGYHYRMCSNKVLGEEQQECKYYAPTDLAYSESSYTSYVGAVFSSGDPTFTGFVTSFEVVNGTLPTGLMLNATTGEISGAFADDACADGCAVTIKAANPDAWTSVTLSFQASVASVSYPTVGAGVHVVAAEDAYLPLSADSTVLSSFTRFEATGLPEGLALSASTGEISGTATGSARSVEVTVKAVLDASYLPLEFTLFVHDHSAAQPFVPAGASCPFILRMYAMGGAGAGAVYLDSGSSTTSLGFTRPAMEAGEVKSVFVCLPDAEYIVHSQGVDLLVLKGTSLVAAFIGEDVVNASFSATPVCDESLDVECDIVIGEGVTLKESGAESGTVYAHREIVELERSTTYEM